MPPSVIHVLNPRLGAMLAHAQSDDVSTKVETGIEKTSPSFMQGLIQRSTYQKELLFHRCRPPLKIHLPG